MLRAARTTSFAAASFSFICAASVDGVEARGILGTMTIDEIVSAIRALPVPERLRVIEIVAHEAASEVPAVAASGLRGGVTLIEHHGLLLVHTDAAMPAEVFDHRLDREELADHIWGGG